MDGRGEVRGEEEEGGVGSHCREDGHNCSGCSEEKYINKEVG